MRTSGFAALLTCSAAPQAPAFDRSGDSAVGTGGDSYGNSASTMASQGIAPWQDANIAHAGCVPTQGSRVFRARGGGGAPMTTRVGQGSFKRAGWRLGFGGSPDSLGCPSAEATNHLRGSLACCLGCYSQMCPPAHTVSQKRVHHDSWTAVQHRPAPLPRIPQVDGPCSRLNLYPGSHTDTVEAKRRRHTQRAPCAGWG